MQRDNNCWSTGNYVTDGCAIPSAAELSVVQVNSRCRAGITLWPRRILRIRIARPRRICQGKPRRVKEIAGSNHRFGIVHFSTAMLLQVGRMAASPRYTDPSSQDEDRTRCCRLIHRLFASSISNRVRCHPLRLEEAPTARPSACHGYFCNSRRTCTIFGLSPYHFRSYSNLPQLLTRKPKKMIMFQLKSRPKSVQCT
jgi:hypothetical protein